MTNPQNKPEATPVPIPPNLSHGHLYEMFHTIEKLRGIVSHHKVQGKPIDWKSLIDDEGYRKQLEEELGSLFRQSTLMKSCTLGPPVIVEMPLPDAQFSDLEEIVGNLSDDESGEDDSSDIDSLLDD